MLTKKIQQKQNKIIEEPIQTVDGEIRIKKYVQLKVVGSGSYSKCYLVKNMDSESTYVAKIIPKKKLQILQKQKLIYEIKIHQSLSHQNVVHLDHWFEDQNNQYILMQYCPNGNLQSKLNQFDCNMNEKDIKRYTRQIVYAIQYIHSQNILHRDLKLCNFYLDANNNVKLGDFGFACQLANSADKKRETCGTPNYIAPQAISGFGYSFSSDVWAIGVILYRLKFGCCPFEGETVKKTLQNVKLCNFKFPTKPKISSQLKDLIQQIFNLNYDDRLSTQQILQHKFFNDVQQFQVINRQLKQQKRGFSLSRLFSQDKNIQKNKKSLKQKQKQKKEPKENQTKNRQGILERQSRNPGVASVKKDEQPKRSNSCQTFKQIKQIFKNKGKQTIATSGPTSSKDMASSPYYTLNTMSNINRQKQITASKTNRGSFLDYSNTSSLNQTIQNTLRKQQSSRSNRLNEFIKTHINSVPLKQQLKASKANNSKDIIIINPKDMNGTNSKNIEVKKQIIQTQQVHNSNNLWLTKNNLKISNNNGLSNMNGIKTGKGPVPQAQQQLYTYSRKYYLPLSIQLEKDVVIIHYRPTCKQIIYSNNSYIMHRTTHNLYKMNGQLVITSQLPKMFKYIIQKKIQIKQIQIYQQYEYAQNNINKIFSLIPQNWTLLKDGIILKYANNNNFIVGKIFAQEGFYIHDQNNNQQPIMYNIGDDQLPKLLQGIVIMRIYSGWIKTNCKK